MDDEHLEEMRDSSPRQKFRSERDDHYSSSYDDRRDRNPRDEREGRRETRDDRKRVSSRSDSRDRKRYRSTSPRPNQDYSYVPNYERDGYAPSRPRENDRDRDNRRRKDRNDGQDPLKFDYILSKRQYIEFLQKKDRKKEWDEGELNEKFVNYRDEFMKKVYEKFFTDNKDMAWFREKYHSVDSAPIREEVNARKREYGEKFLKELESGGIDSISFDEVEGSSKVAAAAAAADKQEDKDDKMDDDDIPADHMYVELQSKKSSDVESEKVEIKIEPSVFIRNIPPNIKRSILMEQCKKTEGFKYLVLSDPFPTRKFIRVGWVVFEDDSKLLITDAEINFTLQHKVYKQTRLMPSQFNTKERIEMDANLIKSLAQTLDQQISFDGITAIENRLKSFDSEKHDIMKKTLDFYIEYLRRVHWYDYYTGHEAISPEDFLRRCPIQLRATASAATIVPFPERKIELLTIRTKIRTSFPTGEELVKLGGKLADDEQIKQRIVRVSEGRFRCPIETCKKLFKAEEFLVKHIRGNPSTKVLGHPDLVKEIETEVDFFNQFIVDRNKGLFVAAPQPPPAFYSNQNVNGMMAPGMGWYSGGYVIPMMPHNGYVNGGGYRGRGRGGGGYQGMGRGGFSQPEYRGEVQEEIRGDLQLDPRATHVRSYLDLDKPVAGGAQLEEISYD
ncbi:hypothetical protein HK098_001710 [Nowakowskiella sp. JEL0407]|nr:hypothetical protein HK098_001710 [Nowakowskiella sp. JEL0407]